MGSSTRFWRVGEHGLAGHGVLHVGAELELAVLGAEPDGDVGVAHLAQHPVHRVAQELFEILRVGDVLAEAFLRADAVELARQLAVGADQVVAEQVDLLADDPAALVQLADRVLELAEAPLLAGDHRLPVQRLLHALDQLGIGERLGDEVGGAAAEGADRAVDARRAGHHDRAGEGLEVAQRGQEAHAVAVGQVHVGDHQVDPLRGDHLFRLGDVGGGDDLAAHPARADDVADHLEEVGLVVDNQHPRRRDRGPLGFIRFRDGGQSPPPA